MCFQNGKTRLVSANEQRNVSSLKELFTDDSPDKKFRVMSIPAEKHETYDYELNKDGKTSTKSNSSKASKNLKAGVTDSRGGSCACTIF